MRPSLRTSMSMVAARPDWRFSVVGAEYAAPYQSASLSVWSLKSKTGSCVNSRLAPPSKTAALASAGSSTRRSCFFNPPTQISAAQMTNSVNMPARVSDSTTFAAHTSAMAAASNCVQRRCAVAARTMASGATISKYIAPIVAYWNEALTRSSPPTRVGAILNSARTGPNGDQCSASPIPISALSPAPIAMAHTRPVS